MLPMPVASRFRVKSLQTALGACISITVTVMEQSVELPVASVARKVTVLVAPAAVGLLGKRLPLGRLGGTRVRVAPGQLSVSVGLGKVTFAPHLPTSLPTVMLGGQASTGFTLSFTDTNTEQVVVLPLTSVAVSVTLKLWPSSTPTGGFWEMLATPQASVALAKAATFGTGALQFASVMGAGQVSIGGVRSRTVTVATQLFTFPAWSVTVSTTVFWSASAQLKLVCDSA